MYYVNLPIILFILFINGYNPVHSLRNKNISYDIKYWWIFIIVLLWLVLWEKYPASQLKGASKTTIAILKLHPRNLILFVKFLISNQIEFLEKDIYKFSTVHTIFDPKDVSYFFKRKFSDYTLRERGAGEQNYLNPVKGEAKPAVFCCQSP